jgi:hypothetical protein
LSRLEASLARGTSPGRTPGDAATSRSESPSESGKATLRSVSIPRGERVIQSISFGSESGTTGRLAPRAESNVEAAILMEMNEVAANPLD